MRVKLLNIGYLKTLKILFLCLVAAVMTVVFYFPNYARLKRLRETNQQIKKDISVLRKEIRDLQGQLTKVGKDGQLYEKVARDNLGVAKEGEIVVDIKE